MSQYTMQEGKHAGKTVAEIWETDKDYVQFLAQNNLTYIQQLKFKAFFDRHAEAVQEAKNLTANIAHEQRVPQPVKYPGGWRGW